MKPRQCSSTSGACPWISSHASASSNGPRCISARLARGDDSRSRAGAAPTGSAAAVRYRARDRQHADLQQRFLRRPALRADSRATPAPCATGRADRPPSTSVLAANSSMPAPHQRGISPSGTSSVPSSTGLVSVPARIEPAAIARRARERRHSASFFAPRCISGVTGSSRPCSASAGTSARGARAQDLVVLLDQPRRRRVAIRCDACDASTTGRVEPKPRRAANATARSMRTGSSWKRSFGSPIERISPSSQILQAADVVDDREGGDVVEQRVDREVAAERVLFGRAEGVVVLDQQVAPSAAPPASVGGGSRPARRGAGLARPAGDVLAERRDLDRLGAEAHVRQAEAAADDPAVPEQLLDLVRVRSSADVEVLRPPAEQQVAHAAAHEVGGS